jgi:hypothetical protein
MATIRGIRGSITIWRVPAATIRDLKDRFVADITTDW